MNKRRHRTKRFIFVALMTALLLLNYDWQKISTAQTSLNAIATCYKDPACASALNLAPNLAAPIVHVSSTASTLTTTTAAGASSAAGKGYLAFVIGALGAFTGALSVALWGDEQNEQARTKALERYCSPGTTNTSQTCPPFSVTVNGQTRDGVAYYVIEEKNGNACGGTKVPVIHLYTSSGGFISSYQICNGLSSVNFTTTPPTKPWSDVSSSARQDAVNKLTNDDYKQIALGSPEAAAIGPGESITGVDIIVVPEEGGAPYQTSGYTHPGNSNPDPDPSPSPSPSSDPSPSPSPSSDPSPSPSPSSDPDPSPSPSPSSDPDPSPSPSPSSDPDPSPSPSAPPYEDPKADKLQPDQFSKPNFFEYAKTQMSKKFPFDFFTGVSGGTVGACPSFTFFTRTTELCIVRDFLSALKWPALIGFAIWGIMEI